MATYKKNYTAVAVYPWYGAEPIVFNDETMDGAGSTVWSLIVARKDIDVLVSYGGQKARVIVPFHSIDHAYRYAWQKDSELPVDSSCA